MQVEAVKKKINRIFELLMSFRQPLRDEGEVMLSRITDDQELDLLIQSAKTGPFRIKYFVIRHLADFESPMVVESLISFLYDENSVISNAAEEALNRVGGEAKYDRLRQLLKITNKQVRLYAIKSIGIGGQFNAVLPLIELLKDGDPDIRYTAIDALRMIGDQRSHDPVIKMLEDKEPIVRYAAVYYCGTRRTAKAGKYLYNLVSDRHPRIRTASVWALGQLDSRWIARLQEILEHEQDENVRNEIFKILKQRGALSVFEDENKRKVCLTTDRTKCISDWLISHYIMDEKPQEADICLFVEGTYPYVSGGVSSWIQDLLKFFHDRTFSLVHLAATGAEIKDFHFILPPNILYFDEINLFDLPGKTDYRNPHSSKDSAKYLEMVYNFVNNMEGIGVEQLKSHLNEMGVYHSLKLNMSDLLSTVEAWEFIKKMYFDSLRDVPFLEYIWTYRAIVLPILNILRSEVPPAKIYYSTLTGYAGFCAALAAVKENKPLLLTEHGIYHRERMMEIEKAGWIYEKKQRDFITMSLYGGLKKVWNDYFRALSKLAYRFSHNITTLFSDNRQMQIETGADPSKIIIIPNGIEPAKFEKIKEKNIRGRESFVVALVGRVVAVKDIKTFIWAAKNVRDKMKKKVEFWILGPTDEDRDYLNQCQVLTDLLEIEDIVKFKGNVDLKEYFEMVDITVLTSISEGQPLSLMEAMSAGIPCVATNVGACRELLYGKDEEDKALGRSGIITSVHSPQETAEAVMEILGDPERFRAMGETGRKRVRKFYNRTDVFNKYGELFDKFLNRES